jgi:hypothetical protein
MEKDDEYSLAFATRYMFLPKQKRFLRRGWKGCP